MLNRINSLAFYIPRFHIDAFEHSFVICAARYWNALLNYIL